MSEIDVEAMKEEIAATLNDDDMQGLDMSDLMEAMSHPKANAVVEKLMALEPNTVQQGEDAPDFTLPWLSGPGADGSTSVTLSTHFGKRPVGLIFGSYT